MILKNYHRLIYYILLMHIYDNTYATTNLDTALEKLKIAYPSCIKAVSADSIIWVDGTSMSLHDNNTSKTPFDKLNTPSLQDQLEQPFYISGKPSDNPTTDPGRIRYEPFFRKMYGNSPHEVESNLTEISWMPLLFGKNTYILRVTTINDMHKKIEKISQELEILAIQHPEYSTFLKQPGGTYHWRTIANTTRLSNHSFGMTIDINATESHYWQWDLARENQTISEESPLHYRNTIPWEIVSIFEKYGFIWGGKWYHYDTMHFEYRPELII